MRRGWTKPKQWKHRDEVYLRRFYAKLPLDRLAKTLRRTACSVKSRAARLHLSRGRRRYSAAEDRLIRKLYPNTLTAEIARRLGRTLTSIHQRANLRLHLKKSAAFTAALDRIEGERLKIFGQRPAPSHVASGRNREVQWGRIPGPQNL